MLFVCSCENNLEGEQQRLPTYLVGTGLEQRHEKDGGESIFVVLVVGKKVSGCACPTLVLVFSLYCREEKEHDDRR